MAQLKIGVQVESLRQPLKKALPLAARTGARGVQIGVRGELSPERLTETGRRAFRRLLEGLGLELVALSFPTRRGYNVPDALENRIAATKRALAFSYELRAPIVTNRIGPVVEDPEDPGRRLQAEALADIAAYAQRVGTVFAVTAGLEPASRLRAFLEALSPAGIAVNFDPAAFVIGNMDPIAAARELGPWIVHTVVRDAVRIAGENRSQEVPLGQGEVDWPECLGALEEIGYRGWFTIRRDQASDPLGDVTRAVQYLENL